MILTFLRREDSELGKTCIGQVCAPAGLTGHSGEPGDSGSSCAAEPFPLGAFSIVVVLHGLNEDLQICEMMMMILYSSGMVVMLKEKAPVSIAKSEVCSAQQPFRATYLQLLAVPSCCLPE